MRYRDIMLSKSVVLRPFATYCIHIKCQRILQSTSVNLLPITAYKSSDHESIAVSAFDCVGHLLERNPALLCTGGPKLLLNPQELIVLGDSLPPIRCSCLDLACTKSHGKIGDVQILHLPDAPLLIWPVQSPMARPSMYESSVSLNK